MARKRVLTVRNVFDARNEPLPLDGGGARGAYQIGAWKALAEAGVKLNAVAGTSVEIGRASCRERV